MYTAEGLRQRLWSERLQGSSEPGRSLRRKGVPVEKTVENVEICKPYYGNLSRAKKSCTPEARGAGGRAEKEKRRMDAENIFPQPVGRERIQELNQILEKYKAGKARLDERVKSAENWWKMRNQFEEAKVTDPKNGGFRAATAWLHNTVTQKQAAAMEAYPEALIYPQEEGDQIEAWALSKIIPVILRKGDFESVYSENEWQKAKMGTGIYKVVWDRNLHGGMGDIAVRRKDLLTVFWEPGVNDIQDSRYFFDVELEDNEALLEKYGEILKREDLGTDFRPEKMPQEDAVYYENKSAVVDCYYKKGGLLHMVKYVGETVLYATENDPLRHDRGLYRHGQYPYVFDALFPIEGSPAGYGYIDIEANCQTRIDILNTGLTRNAVSGSNPRYFARSSGGINEDEFLNVENTLVHYTGSMNKEDIIPIQTPAMNAAHLTYQEALINELRECSTNTETLAGTGGGGVTSAKGVLALQNAAMRTSRASSAGSYRAFRKIVYMIIEDIRQFYDTPRQFRILGENGVPYYIRYDNRFLRTRPGMIIGDVQLPPHTPEFDIEVQAERQSADTKAVQNELMLNFYNLGMLNPANADMAITALGAMDFKGKDELIAKIDRSRTLSAELGRWQQTAVALANKLEPELARRLAELAYNTSSVSPEG